MVEKSEKILIKIKLTPEELKTLENEREEARKNGERFSMRAVLERRFEKGLEEMEKIIDIINKIEEAFREGMNELTSYLNSNTIKFSDLKKE